MTFVWWQRLLLIIALASAVVTLIELLLLEHIEEWQQVIPVALLAATIVSLVVVLATSSRWAVRLLRVVLAACFISALVGMYFHYQSNVEFILERHPKYAGFQLFKSAMMGAMPALAPGAMAQLALIGWLATVSRRPA